MQDIVRVNVLCMYADFRAVRDSPHKLLNGTSKNSAVQMTVVTSPLDRSMYYEHTTFAYVRVFGAFLQTPETVPLPLSDNRAGCHKQRASVRTYISFLCTVAVLRMHSTLFLRSRLTDVRNANNVQALPRGVAQHAHIHLHL